MADRIVLDGSQGEGGGQILRSALSLSLVTETPIRIENVRARRSRPGLLRQHLVAARAAARICNGELRGDHIGSSTVELIPGPVRAGRFDLDIGSAGSTTLVLQTVLPPLLCAGGPSIVTIRGGTHNPLAPTFESLEHAFLSIMRKMGADISVRLIKPGFYPAGGGEIELHVRPTALQPIELTARGALRSVWCRSTVANLPLHIAERELRVVANALELSRDDLEVVALSRETGTGNVLTIGMESDNHCEVVSVVGERRVPAETVADRAVTEARAYLESDAAVGEHLADQLLLPLALAGGGAFTAVGASMHSLTNIKVIERFIPAVFRVSDAGRHVLFEVSRSRG